MVKLKEIVCCSMSIIFPSTFTEKKQYFSVLERTVQETQCCLLLVLGLYNVNSKSSETRKGGMQPMMDLSSHSGKHG